MFTFAADATSGIIVGLFSGPSNTDEDYKRYLEIIDGFARDPSRKPIIALVVVDRENPTPSALWRKKFAEASARVPAHALFVLVSQPPVIRAVMTALAWVRPPTYKTLATSTFAEGCACVEREQGPLTRVLVGLLGEARKKSQLP